MTESQTQKDAARRRLAAQIVEKLPKDRAAALRVMRLVEESLGLDDGRMRAPR